MSSERSTATIWRAPASLAPRTTLKPTPPKPTTATDWPGSSLAVLIDRANAGQHRAAEQGGEFERQVGVDLHARFARHHRMGRKGRDAEKMVDRLGVEREPPLAGEQRPGGVRLCPRLAERRTPGRARAAAAAARHEHQHDMIAGVRGRSPRRRLPRRFAAASWPSAIGVGRGREPSITDRSEWHRPAAAILTSTSPRPGGARSSSMISSGFEAA